MDEIVYINKSGKKYYAKYAYAGYPITLKEAIERGYTPSKNYIKYSKHETN